MEEKKEESEFASYVSLWCAVAPEDRGEEPGCSAAPTPASVLTRHSYKDYRPLDSEPT